MQESVWTVEARRWAKFPATLLLALSLVWLVCLVFKLEPVVPNLGPKTGIGVLGTVYALGVIPLGSVACAIGLLFLQSWAYVPAALLPLWPLILLSSDKSARIAKKFSDFHQTQDASSLGNGVIDSLVLLSFWVVYALCLHYLWKSWQSLPRQAGHRRRPAAIGAAAHSTGYSSNGQGGSIVEEGDVCMLMPETADEGDS